MPAVVRYLITMTLVGLLGVGLAWAGSGVVPVGVPQPSFTPGNGNGPPSEPPGQAKKSPEPEPTQAPPPVGNALVGASAVSIVPQPGDGEVWKKEGCRIVGSDAQQALQHVGDLRNTWPEDPNCIYMGGYGIGPANPMVSVDASGLWVRSVAVGDGTNTVVMSVIDATSYFGRYNRMCGELSCGAFDIAEEMGAELGIPSSNFMIASTHSHTAPDLIGGWGGVPRWYMDQVAAAIRESISTAVEEMRPAALEMGESIVRARNGERRDYYRSAEDPFLGWFRAVDPGTGRAIATVGTYAAHPVTADARSGVGDADFPMVFNSVVEERFGGVGLYFATGLGNMSPRGDKNVMGRGLAAAVPEIGAGRPVAAGAVGVTSAQRFWDQPVTNPVLTGLALPGFFDRTFQPMPAALATGKSAQRPCTSASPVSVRTAVSAFKIGDLWVAGAPGETFSNLAMSLKERNPSGIVLPLSQVNDGLGYLIQDFESDAAGRQGLGFAGAAEYEDAYSLDGCFGDKVLETTISLFG